MRQDCMVVEMVALLQGIWTCVGSLLSQSGPLRQGNLRRSHRYPFWPHPLLQRMKIVSFELVRQTLAARRNALTTFFPLLHLVALPCPLGYCLPSQYLRPQRSISCLDVFAKVP